jgi:hypothetical protein
METAHETESQQVLTEADPLARPRLGAEAVRASLEAVRVAQVAARARARRETRWARLIAAGALTAMGVTAWAAAPRPARARAAVPSVAAASLPPAAAPQPPAPSPSEAPAAAAAAPSVAPLPAEKIAVAAADSEARVAPCDEAFAQRNWAAIASTCTAAFAARPQDSALAMRVAQAEHRRGHVAAAADWARKAIALDKEIPEAFVIVARAEVAEGHARAAADTYQRYLALAPRGWHAAEARRAVRAAR